MLQIVSGSTSEAIQHEVEEEALTTWRASLATLGVVLRNWHCGRLDNCEDRVIHLESRGKALEAITFDVLDWRLLEEAIHMMRCQDFRLR